MSTLISSSTLTGPSSLAIDLHLIPPAVIQLCKHFTKHDGKAWLVGGCVRDLLLGINPKDYDLEVYGLDETTLISLLKKIGRCESVGKQFGVHKLWTQGLEIDVALPRTESKAGSGHCAFDVLTDPSLSPEIASLRRDFTINAMMYDPLTEQLLDMHHGIENLHHHCLRHVSPAFAEDPLRPLRAMQFAARFRLQLAEDTAQLCRKLLPEAASLPASRIWCEWQKWAHAPHPSFGLHALRDCGWLALYPELAALVECHQDPRWHPEGDVWLHSLQVVDQAAFIATRNQLNTNDREYLLFAALCHDLGKPQTTIHRDDGRISSPGHSEAGVPLTSSFLQRIHAPGRVAKQILPLVHDHITHLNGQPTARAIRRLAHRLQPAHIELWEMLVEADASGRSPAPPSRPAYSWLLKAQEMQQHQQPVARIVDGAMLIKLGIAPGPTMGAILNHAYEAQLNGEFHNHPDAKKWCTQYIQNT